MLLKTGSDILKRLGYEVVSFADPLKALETFNATPDRFDLVITDLTMPNLTGIGFNRELREIRPDVPVILCTGFGRGVSEQAAQKQGFKAFLDKPINISILAKTLREILDSK